MADGSIKIDVDVGIQQAEKQLEELKKKAQDSGDSVSESMDIDIKSLDNQFESAKVSIEETTKAIEKTEKAIDEINSKKIDLSNLKSQANELTQERNLLRRGGAVSFDGSDEEYLAKLDSLLSKQKELTNQIILTEQEVSKLGSTETLSDKLEVQNNKLDRQSLAYERLGLRAERYSNKIDNANDNTSKLNNETKKVDSSMKSASKSSGDMGKNLGMGIKRLTKYALALFSIRTVYQTLRRLSNQWLNSDNAAAKQVKANISAMSQALSNALGPVIQWLANLMAYVFGYVNAILKAFFGIDLLAKNTAKNTGGVASNTKKARKEAEKFSSAFDKADIASSKVADNMDGAGGGGGMDIATPNIPTPDISGFVNFFDNIKKMMKDIWETDTVQSFFDSIYRIGINTFNMLTSIISNIVRNWGTVFDVMLPHVQRGTEAMIEFYRLMLEDIANATDTWFPIITDSFNSFVDSVFDTFRPIFEFMAQLWADTWEMVLELWQKYGKSLLDGFFGFINNTIQIFEKLWAIIDTIIGPILDIFKNWWNDTLRDVIMEVLSFVAELVILAMNIYNKFISPIVKFLLDILQPAFAVVFGVAGGIITGFLNLITNVISLIVTAFKGLIQILNGIFSGDWTKIWEGAVNIVSSIFGAVVGIVRVPINFMIDLLNGFIRGLNRIKIPKWVPGFGGMGININPIPRLAQGTYVTGGAMTAIVGEAGKEAVVPLENNTEWIHDFLNLANANGGLGGGGTNVTNIILDGSVLATATSKEESKRNVLLNGVLA